MIRQLPATFCKAGVQIELRSLIRFPFFLNVKFAGTKT
jgi:hypothetical protein